MKPSMGSVGDARDNEMCESFFTTRECELIRWTRDQAEAKTAVFDLFEGFHNPHRRHPALDYQSPINFERSREAATRGRLLLYRFAAELLTPLNLGEEEKPNS